MSEPPNEIPTRPPWWDWVFLKATGLSIVVTALRPSWFGGEVDLVLLGAGAVLAGGREGLTLLSGFLKK